MDTLLIAYLIVVFAIFINIVVLIFWANDRTQAAAERKDLYDRLQAGTLSDYKGNKEEAANEVDEEDPNLLDLNDPEARAQITGEEIEE